MTPEGKQKTFYGRRVLFLCGTVGNGEKRAEVEEKESQPEQGSAHARKGCYLESLERMIRGRAGKSS